MSPLFAGVAGADGDGIVFQSLVVNCHAPGRADFVLRVVALADVAAVVPNDWK